VKPATARCAFVSMRNVLVIALVAACGGKPAPSGPGSGSQTTGVVKDTRTEIERRRDAACESLAGKLFQCGVEDSDAELAAGRISKKEHDLAVDGESKKAFHKKWMEECRVEMSSRQVRVLEVCYREETTCGPLLDCLGHLQDRPQGK
jgi:hypothetical protein